MLGLTAMSSEVIPIPLNRNSSLRSDIEIVYHVPLRRLVIIELIANASCSNPVLRGRLSGQSLWAFSLYPLTNMGKSRLKEIQSHMRINKYENVFVGKYGRSVLQGKHYIEIIHLYCNGWTNQTHDFSSVCLESPLRHRITEISSSVEILSSHKDEAFGKVPFWANKRLVHNRTGAISQHNPQESNLISIEPMYTRYQPSCPPNSDPSCMNAANTKRFLNYTFIWPQQSDPTIMLSHHFLNDTKNLNQRSRVCFMGASHTREIKNHLYSVFGNRIIDSVAAFDAAAKYTDYVEANAEHFVTENGCNSLVIGVGQWPAGWPEGRPHLFNEYKKNMQSMIQTLVMLKNKLEITNAQHPAVNTSLKLYLRSMHYNALGNRMTACPPDEWRNPFVVDGYNLIAKQLASESMGKVKFIDTNFIIGPMWDSPEDWCHFKNEAGRQDALFLLAKTFLPDYFSGIESKQARLRIEGRSLFSHSNSTSCFFLALWIFVTLLVRTVAKWRASNFGL